MHRTVTMTGLKGQTHTFCRANWPRGSQTQPPSTPEQHEAAQAARDRRNSERNANCQLGKRVKAATKSRIRPIWGLHMMNGVGSMNGRWEAWGVEEGKWSRLVNRKFWQRSLRKQNNCQHHSWTRWRSRTYNAQSPVKSPAILILHPSGEIEYFHKLYLFTCWQNQNSFISNRNCLPLTHDSTLSKMNCSDCNGPLWCLMVEFVSRVASD